METKDILNYCESLKALGGRASALFADEIETTKDILATEVICLASLNKTKENDDLLQSKEIQDWICNSENKTSFLFRRLLEMASRDSSPEKYVEGFSNIKKLLKSKIAKQYTPEVIVKNEVRMSESYLITGKNTWLNIFNGVYDKEWIEFLNNIGLKVPSSVVESYGRPDLPTFAITNSISLLGINKILQKVCIEKDGIFLKEVVRKGRFDVLDMLVQQKHQCVKNLVSESLEWVGSLHGKSFIEHYKYFIEKYSVIICLAYEGDQPYKEQAIDWTLKHLNKNTTSADLCAMNQMKNLAKEAHTEKDHVNVTLFEFSERLERAALMDNATKNEKMNAQSLSAL